MNRNKSLPSEKHAAQQYLPAGDFSSWLSMFRTALVEQTGVEVDCGDCVGCCTSSYFILVKPEDIHALNRINKDMLFPAPGLPKGHLLMGYDRKGVCPQFKNSRCSIYDDRPQTCRNYDCRVFAAAGIPAGGKDKAVINQRVRQWRFSYPTGQDREEHAAAQAAATFIRGHAKSFPGGRVPGDPSQLAVLVIKVYEVFLKRGDSEALSDTDIAKAVVQASRAFDGKMEG